MRGVARGVGGGGRRAAAAKGGSGGGCGWRADFATRSRAAATALGPVAGALVDVAVPATPPAIAAAGDRVAWV